MDDEERPRSAPRFKPMVFDGWDVAQLKEYIESLRTEISRAEAAIGARDAQRLAAEAFFKKG
ncbi:MAG: DUF1192 domain-containing protein [Roseomonas sp.]|nr:DUF1192 domain-containing protein [Roseomonas sp.]